MQAYACCSSDLKCPKLPLALDFVTRYDNAASLLLPCFWVLFAPINRSPFKTKWATNWKMRFTLNTVIKPVCMLLYSSVYNNELASSYLLCVLACCHNWVTAGGAGDHCIICNCSEVLRITLIDSWNCVVELCWAIHSRHLALCVM